MLFSRNSARDLSREAIKTVTANIMLADKDLNIVYINDAVKNLLEQSETDLKRELPRFSMASLVGSNIDIFHKNPAHQRGMLSNMSGTFRTQIKVGDLYFGLIANPILSAGASVGLSYADTYLAGKLRWGWHPNLFVQEVLKPFTGPNGE